MTFEECLQVREGLNFQKKFTKSHQGKIISQRSYMIATKKKKSKIGAFLYLYKNNNFNKLIAKLKQTFQKEQMIGGDAI